MIPVAYVLGLAVSERPAPPPESLPGLVTWSERFFAAARALAPFRTLSPADSRPTVGEFEQAWLELRQCLADLAAALGIEVTFLRGLGDDRERMYRDRLHRLSADLDAERAGGEGSPDSPVR